MFPLLLSSCCVTSVLLFVFVPGQLSYMGGLCDQRGQATVSAQVRLSAGPTTTAPQAEHTPPNMLTC